MRRSNLTVDVVAELFRQLADKPIYEIMRDEERAAGYEPILPGSRPWFSADDWHETDVVSVNDKHVRIVAILAKNPGYGAFSRLIDGILAAGLTPLVVCPFPQMEAILKRWGWRGRMTGRGVDQQELWRPPHNWHRKAS